MGSFQPVLFHLHPLDSGNGMLNAGNGGAELLKSANHEPSNLQKFR
jgi:hypothetical protein